MSVLVTGGAGYIGAHVVRCIQEQGRDVVIVDRDAVRAAARAPGVPVEIIDLASDAASDRLVAFIQRRAVDSIIHLAALKSVSDSVARPAEYFRQNLGGLAAVVDAAERTGVERLVFSSSAAVYGIPGSSIIDETEATNPINPYGETKLTGEWMLRDAEIAFGLRSVSLRYFNVAGAGWPDLGDTAALNLITIALQRVIRGQAPTIYGDNFDTPDGSGVRDYVHVLDLALAHIGALDYLDRDERPFDVFNVGTGVGSSVREVIGQIARVSGIEIAPDIRPRRHGDPAHVVADSDRISSVLGWKPQFDLPQIIDSAWQAAQRSTQSS